MRNLFKYAVFLFVQIFFVTNASSQNDTAYFMQNYRQGNILHNATKIDSSMLYYEKAYTWSKQNPFFDTSKAVTELMSVMGRCYRLQNKVQLAHGILTTALNNARKYHHIISKETIFKRLCALHDYIVEKNLPFEYPQILETELAEVYFSIKQIEPLGKDSLKITVNAGRLDGIVNANSTGNIYTRIIEDDSTRKSISLVLQTNIYELKDNSTILHVLKDLTNDIRVNDFFQYPTQIPTNWRNLLLRQSIMDNVFFNLSGTAGDKLYSYRYYYYFGDTTIEKETLQCFLADAKVVAKSVAKDTLTNTDRAYKYDGGIFSGENMFRALIITEPVHVELFLKYKQAYPASLMGNPKYFAVELAGWVATKSTLEVTTIKPYLLNIGNITERQRQAFNLRKQIKRSGLIETWLSMGMQQINEENIDGAQLTASLLNDVISITKDTSNFGWAEYLLASIEKKKGNSTQANIYLEKAQLLFNDYNNFEGKAWVKATAAKWLIPTSLQVGMQTGHGLNYIIALSPNPNYFATGGRDFLIKIWDKKLGKEIVTLTKHKGTITSLHFSPNGKYLVSAANDNTVTIWNAYNYTELANFTTDVTCYVAKFSPNSKLLYVAVDSTLNIINPFVDSFALLKKIVLHHQEINDFDFDKRDANIIYSCSNQELRKWNISDSILMNTYKGFTNIKSIKISKDGRYMSTISSDSLITVRDSYTAKNIVSLKVFLDANQKKYTFPAMYAVHSFSPDSRFLIFPSAKDSIGIAGLLEGKYREKSVNMNGGSIRYSLLTSDGEDILVTSVGNYIKQISFKGFDFYKNYQTDNKNSIKFFSNQIYTIQYSKDDKGLYFFQFGPAIGKIDLSNLGYRNKTFEHIDNQLETPHILLSGDTLMPMKLNSIANKIFIFSNGNDSVPTKAIIELPTNETVFSFESSSDNANCFASSNNGWVVGWNIATNKQIFSTQLKTDTTTASMILYYDNNYNRLFTKVNTSYVVIINPQNGVITDSLQVNRARQIISTPSKIYITTGNGELKIFDAKTLAQLSGWTVNNTKEEASKMLLSPNNKYLILQNTTKSIMAFDTKVDTMLYVLPDHPYTSWSIAMSHSGEEFATAGGEGNIFIYETSTGKKKATVYMPYNKDPFIVDDENHYLSSKNTLESINLNYNDNVYNYDQFDVLLNRPDIVLQKLGRGDTALINNYFKAYKKRVKKLGIDEKNISYNLHLPSIKLKDRFAIETSTTAKDYIINVECTDTKFPIQSIQVIVNNSPVLGINGRDVSKENTKQILQKITIPLASGNNAIKVYCTNSQGISSLKESFTVLSTFNKDSITKIYFVGIGVANYKDKSMNLTYSAKDIRDLAADFTRVYGKNFKVIIDTLLDQNVTKENIGLLKKRLLETTPNDRVVIAITGHGILSDSLNFYYATCDINFAKPELRGLPYEQIEALLNDVPAQEKIMFIDACHSGALDKEELLAIKNSKKNIVVNAGTQKNVKGIASRSSIKITNKVAKVNANSSFELMQNLFSDLSSSNGAVIISAAGGMEYAYESAKWNNGVFTYSIREGIFDGYADKYYSGNNNGQVTVQELTNYVNKRVSELTNGKQKPTSRRENIDFDWVIKFY